MSNMITIQTLIENNVFENAIDAAIEPYRIILDSTDWIDKFVKFLKAKVLLSVKSIQMLNTLYDLESCTNMINAYFNEEINNLLTNSFVESILMVQDNTTQDIGATNQFVENIQNYQGFDVTNQDGQFLKNTQGVKNSGGTNKLQYLEYIRTFTNSHIKRLINWLKSNICILIY